MKVRNRWVNFRLFVIVFVLMGIIACSNGNDGNNEKNSEDVKIDEINNDSGNYTTPQYNGSKAPAEITADNYEEIITTAFERTYEIGDLYTESSGFSYVEISDFLYSFAEQSLKQFGAELNHSTPFSTVRKTELTGICGGSANVSLNVSETNGKLNFTMSVTFFEYCLNDFCSYEEDILLNGEVIITGVMSEIDTGEIEIFSLSESIDDLLISSSYNVLYMDGQIDLVVSDSNCSFMVNMVWEDLASEETYKIVNMEYKVNSENGSISVSFSGRFYHPDYGFLYIEATDEFVIDENGDIISGALIGYDEYGSSIKLTVSSTNSYTVEADLDGDGVYEKTTK